MTLLTYAAITSVFVGLMVAAVVDAARPDERDAGRARLLWLRLVCWSICGRVRDE
ncbi:hypothetical protein DSM104299_03215 [Baekduia alba]|uniref:hypothetical protein n=1 Tax=Baekduia alba TaxID=2997333 RepID=UPI002341CEAF|nr:hypothetical protein [Baekduia alba]WCB94478.1 hypothetical protein DSM104299_03215 [Baekduia alba]